jgi:hypothetical protein
MTSPIMMRLKPSPIAMDAIDAIIDTEVYIDDIGAFSHSWDDHIALLRTILTKLQDC